MRRVVSDSGGGWLVGGVHIELYCCCVRKASKSGLLFEVACLLEAFLVADTGLLPVPVLAFKL